MTFFIKKGETSGEIAHNLKEKGLILDEGTFKLYAKLNGVDRNIVAGRFIVSRSQNMPEIVAIITDSKKSEMVLTVPEGTTIQQIDEKLVALGAIETGDFVKAINEFKDYDKYPFIDREAVSGLAHPLEGYLFPDTYFLESQNFYSEDLIQLMLNNFAKRMEPHMGELGKRSLHEVITMASIVEMEVRTTDDRPIVAGILWKRLDSGWMIGADATLLYLKEDRSIDYQDLQEESPYNTRKNAGLPPGPIGNPGIKAILATLTPEESPYFFYLTTLDTGEVIYAVTNEEHNANKVKYLQ
ncbi:MAG TPA: endolytic transglycosylase MltG [Candidatus Gracilibacteria bacterium]|nr:endolytic transglycosylase MltG [Candidatus Gracilibacteria bacterium]